MAFFLLFILGLIVGSLVNVIIYRTEKEESFLIGRSYCPHCRKKIAFYDNIPLVSYLILRGRCRYCQAEIGWHYPVVEFLTALSMVILLAPLLKSFDPEYFFPVGGMDLTRLVNFFSQILYGSFIVIILVSVFIFDAKHYIIPDKFVFWGSAVVFSANLIMDFKLGMGDKIKIIFSSPEIFNELISSYTIRGLLGVLVAAGFFFWQVWISKEKWMGWGDVKLGVFMGFLLGFPVILVALFIAYLLGAIGGIFLLITKKKNLKSPLPFGPFLCLGSYLALIGGEEIVYAYLKLLE